MDIALRKQKILAAVIEGYIATGEPIGSKALQQTDDFSVSSATIRNELADLTNRGFLKQPHTSAGRVPTEIGYRYYVDNLMKVQPLGDRVKGYIENRLEASSDAPEHILKTASQVVSELTATASIATTPSGEDVRVHQIKFVQTGRHTSMVVLITSSGMVKSRLFRCDFDITPQMLDVFDRALNDSLAGEPLSAINQPFIQTFAASFGELSLIMPDMLMAVMDACKEAVEVSAYLSGATKLLYHTDMNFVASRTVFEFLSDNSNRSKLLQNVPDGTQIYIGRENIPPELKHSSLITTRYEIDNQPAGAVALVAPLRFNYPLAVSILEHTAKTTGELIGEIISTGH
jgi:heat-inducible transcriptional repressor